MSAVRIDGSHPTMSAVRVDDSLNTMSAVRVDVNLTDRCPPRQVFSYRCPPRMHSPTLFNILLEVLMALAVNGADDHEVLISGCRKNTQSSLRLLAKGTEDLVILIPLVNMTSERFGLRVSGTKTVV